MRTEKGVIRNIRKLRELRLLTREQMAAELELSVSGYGRLERGEIDLTLSRMRRIAEILNVNISELLDFEPATVLTKSRKKSNPDAAAAEDAKYMEYREKYITMLEMELERLREEIRELKRS